ncbi:MAG: hypothetical protein M2R45_01771 [Verrucomicrobia subdivision 3 bacterium]|nr:hypothetical protein [Limisphaerales bacterium]MCS1415874.1 hypothetical protein [Limisphaerales bacterium]
MFDNPIFYIILISLISVVSEWVGKRRKARRMAEEGPLSPSPEDALSEPEVAERRRSVASQGAQEWEERLRRLLGEETDTTPAAASPLSPEPIRTEPVVPPPPPPVKSPVIEAYHPPEPSAPHPQHLKPLATQQKMQDATQWGKGTKSAQGLDSTGDIPKKVRQSFRRQAVTAKSFRDRNALRQAIVASVVLSPPKGTEEEPDLLRL